VARAAEPEGGGEYVDHYRRCLSVMHAEILDCNYSYIRLGLQGTRFSANNHIPCVVRWLTSSLSSIVEGILGLRTLDQYVHFPIPSSNSSPIDSKTPDVRFSGFCPRIYLSTKYFNVLLSSCNSVEDAKSDKIEKCFLRAYLATVGSEKSFTLRDRLPILLRLLGESAVVIQRDHLEVKDGWSTEMLTMLGREDLSFGTVNVRHRH